MTLHNTDPSRQPHNGDRAPLLPLNEGEAMDVSHVVGETARLMSGDLSGRVPVRLKNIAPSTEEGARAANMRNHMLKELGYILDVEDLEAELTYTEKPDVFTVLSVADTEAFDLAPEGSNQQAGVNATRRTASFYNQYGQVLVEETIFQLNVGTPNERTSCLLSVRNSDNGPIVHA